MQITNLKNSIVQAGIKELWHSEEKDFSPFIAEHLNEISDLIGIQFGTYELEKRVGRYKADIVTNIIGEDNSVAIIENKLNSFDHDHLGKAITYMSYLNAKCIIWICDSFNDEHIKAINYLNKITGDEYLFFGITVNLYKFNNDNYSYEFNILAKPDYIEKDINSNLSEKSIETRNLYLKYWNELRKSLKPKELQESFYIANRGQNYSPITKRINNVSLVPKILIKDKQTCLCMFLNDDKIDIDDLCKYLNDNTKFNVCKENGKRNKNIEYLSITNSYKDDIFDTINQFANIISTVYNVLHNYNY